MSSRNIVFKKEKLERGKDHKYLCKSLITAVSTGTETTAYIGANSLRNSTTYPRLMGYLNIAEIIGQNQQNADSSFQIGDLIVSNQSHRSKFWVGEKQILAKIDKQNFRPQVSLAYLYFLANEAIKLCGNNWTNLNVFGGGLISSILDDLLKIDKRNITYISDFANLNKLNGDYTRQSKLSLSRELFDKNPHQADNTIVLSSYWSDVKRALQNTKFMGNIIIVGFPGRDNSLPDFNPFNPNEFYGNNLNYLTLPIGTILTHDQKQKLDKLAKEISIGKLAKNFENIPKFKPTEISKAYEELLAYPRIHDTLFIDWS